MLKPNSHERIIWLEAIDPARNIARRYTVLQNHDLFGHIIVEYGWGRIGTRGQVRTVSFVKDMEAERFVAGLLRRRAGAPKRIGVPYRVVTILG